MRVVERVRHLAREPDRDVRGQSTLSRKPRPQRFAFDEGHHVPQHVIRASGVEQRQDVRVLQTGGELDLLEEPLGPEHGRELGVQHLERHAPAVPHVLGEVDCRHPPRAQLALDAVAVGDARREPRGIGGHLAVPSFDFTRSNTFSTTITPLSR